MYIIIFLLLLQVQGYFWMFGIWHGPGMALALKH
jgi:hypothetical protein